MFNKDDIWQSNISSISELDPLLNKKELDLSNIEVHDDSKFYAEYGGRRDTLETEYFPPDTEEDSSAQGVQMLKIMTNTHGEERTILLPPPYILQGERRPIKFQCQYCSYIGITDVRHNKGLAVVVAVLICLILFCPLFWLPFCCKRLSDTTHVCPDCRRKIGTSRLL